MAKELDKLTNAELEALNQDLGQQIDALRDQKRAIRSLHDERSLTRRSSIWETAPDGIGGAFTGSYEQQWYDDRPEDTTVDPSAAEDQTVVEAEPAVAGGAE